MMWLFDTSGFVTRDQCGPWDPALKWTYIAANAIFAVSYFGMPLEILALWVWRRQDMLYPWVLLLFVAFIGLCGLTHAADVVVFWWPAYRLFTLNAVLGAIVSFATLCLLPIEIAFLRKVPTPKQWRTAQDQLKDTIAAHEATLRTMAEAHARMQEHVNHIEQLLAIGKWGRTERDTLSGLRYLLRNGPDA